MRRVADDGDLPDGLIGIDVVEGVAFEARGEAHGEEDGV